MTFCWHDEISTDCKRKRGIIQPEILACQKRNQLFPKKFFFRTYASHNLNKNYARLLSPYPSYEIF